MTKFLIGNKVGNKGLDIVGYKFEGLQSWQGRSGIRHCIHNQEAESRLEVELAYQMSKPTPKNLFLLSRTQLPRDCSLLKEHHELRAS